MIEVVIPVHNRRAITLRCLELLAEQVDVEFRVTVVDDGSSDGTSQAIRDRFPNVDLSGLHETLSGSVLINELLRQFVRGRRSVAVMKHGTSST